MYDEKNHSYLEGQLLIATPSMTDPRFEKAVILICAHNTEGAMGIIINPILLKKVILIKMFNKTIKVEI